MVQETLKGSIVNVNKLLSFLSAKTAVYRTPKTLIRPGLRQNEIFWKKEATHRFMPADECLLISLKLAHAEVSDH